MPRHAEWRTNDQWASGYWFDVVAKDHGEPGSQPSAKNGFMVDTYHFTIRKMDDPDAKVSGPIVYEVKGGWEHPDASTEQRSPRRAVAAAGVGGARALIAPRVRYWPASAGVAWRAVAGTSACGGIGIAPWVAPIADLQSLSSSRYAFEMALNERRPLSAGLKRSSRGRTTMPSRGLVVPG